ncbi:hypothetical protein BSU04_37050 [Caballeronia sordidicola]|uniref:Uncharacterized protein n=1 Tax=Caballeronia sordidicola TaxID=196367 RepID=A0A226WQD7_CABSO|nr:hypothetical protein BSU04_37050 [Caballeronia sordidicola]
MSTLIGTPLRARAETDESPTRHSNRPNRLMPYLSTSWRAA